jgi:3-isopropylmalate/(R)-2-methylmalate dehydratase large subunit
MNTMNLAEKILAETSGKDMVSSREIVYAKVDTVMIKDLAGPLAVECFKKIGVQRVWNNRRIVIIFNHVVPASSIKAGTIKNQSKDTAIQVTQVPSFVPEIISDGGS